MLENDLLILNVEQLYSIQHSKDIAAISFGNLAVKRWSI
jgi:hypothetical protein